jgi:DNA-binding response OmpR family regulator
MPTILLADDDPDFRDVLALSFEEDGWEVNEVGNGDAALRELRTNTPDILICDINMPGADGFTVCRTARDEGIDVPIILLTTRDGDIDEALGLDLGADDYVTKPFSDRALKARVRALMRRTTARRDDSPDADSLTRGPLNMEPEKLRATCAGQAIDLTVTEFRLLHFLARSPGRVYSRGQLLDAMRADDSFVAERMVDSYIGRIRRKLGEAVPDFEPIETVIGAGYRWSEDAV